MPTGKRESDRGPRPSLYDRKGRLRSFHEVKPFESARLLGEMAEYYGLNRAEYSAFGVLELALAAPLPAGWTEYVNRRNYTIYVNPSKSKAFWSHPADIFFFSKAREAIGAYKALILWRNLSTRRHFQAWRISHAADIIWKLQCENSHFRALVRGRRESDREREREREREGEREREAERGEGGGREREGGERATERERETS